ncbi:unnamed protein product [Urochloa decumbens]|uniref:Uncharacterized protein n=1 Tax=Urochloa decumbens TaxID=240449 RepID=A0ABC9D7E1_9POAL
MNMTCNALESKTMKQEPSTMSGVVVTKASPVVVRPSSPELELRTPPPPRDTVTLSPFDRPVPPIPATSLFVFDRPIDEPAETIRRALSRALAHYRPFAGRLDGAGGIACTDDGATFVAASASCLLREATAAALQEMDDLAVLYPGLLCRDADPLLMVQVTEFACGGFVVGVTSNHVVADGAGMSQFLRTVADLARDGVALPPPSPVRAWDGGSCRSLPAPVLAVPKSPATIQHEPPPRLARLDVVVPYGLIRHIKAGGFGAGGEQCTALDAVMAVLWRCRTRAALSAAGNAAESPAPLKFVCNMRALAGAPAGYYGNCIRAQVVMATAGAVSGGSIGDLVRLIRRAKEKIPDLLLSGGGVVAAEDQAQAAAKPVWYEAFSVTDWRYLGLDAIDFGGGAPARVLWHIKRILEPGCVVCPPRRAGAGGDGSDGVDVTSMFVKPEHADAFLGELARLAVSAE